nr:polyadenylate-binding protein 2-A-like [Lytechinus pictus]
MAELETMAEYGTYLPDVSGGEDSLLSPTETVPSLNLEQTEENAGIEDEELEAIKARVREMEEEAEKLKEMQNEVDKQMNLSSPPPAQAVAHLSMEEKGEVDARSVYVGNVDYSATAEELESHFHGCGSINRVTILCDKFTGHPKGYAYVEFVEKDSVDTACTLNLSLFKGRQIKVNAKRTNRPGISTTDRPPRGGFSGQRGRGRGRYGQSAFGGGGGYGGGGGGFYRAQRPRFRWVAKPATS